MDFVVIVWASHLVTLFKKNFMVCKDKIRVEKKLEIPFSFSFNLGCEENQQIFAAAKFKILFK